MKDSLTFLSNKKKTEESMRKYARGTEEYKRLLSESKKQGFEESPSPLKVFSLEELLVFLSVVFEDELEISFSVSAKPLVTNGKWHEEEKRISWSRRIDPVRQGSLLIPVTCFAAWVKPDVEAQKACFGREFLNGENLRDYCLWETSLSPEKRKKWEELILSLRRADKPRSKLRELSFANEDEQLESGFGLVREALKP